MSAPTRGIAYPDAWTAYPGITPAMTTGSVYNNNSKIYPFDVPYLQSRSRANGDFIAQKPRYGKERLCAYSCGVPAQVDLLGSIASKNQARYY